LRTCVHVRREELHETAATSKRQSDGPRHCSAQSSACQFPSARRRTTGESLPSPRLGNRRQATIGYDCERSCSSAAMRGLCWPAGSANTFQPFAVRPECPASEPARRQRDPAPKLDFLLPFEQSVDGCFWIASACPGVISSSRTS